MLHFTFESAKQETAVLEQEAAVLEQEAAALKQKAEAIEQGTRNTVIGHLTLKLQKKFGKMATETISDDELITTFNALMAWMHKIYALYTREQIVSWALDIIRTTELFKEIPALAYLRDNLDRLFPAAVKAPVVGKASQLSQHSVFSASAGVVTAAVAPLSAPVVPDRGPVSASAAVPAIPSDARFVLK